MSSYTGEQREFINYPTDSPNSVLLSATAGSGKTHSAVGKLKKMLEDGIDPNDIIFFSFTNDAVKELRSRIEHPDITVTTIHSYTSSMLGKMQKYKPISTFYEFAAWFKEKYKPKAYEKINVKLEFQRTMDKFYEDSAQISSGFSAYKLQNADSIRCIKPKYYDEYKTFLNETKSRDFSDLLIETERLSCNPQYERFFKGTYKYVFIDEYQDTSTLQLKILLKIDALQYFLIGDKNQCLTAGSEVLTKHGYKLVEDLEIGDEVNSGIGCGNVSFKKVTNVSKNYYTGPLIELITKTGKKITTTPKHTHFAQFSFENENKYLLYLMFKRGIGYRIGKTEIYPKRNVDNNSDRFGFKFRLNQEHADKLWVINSYSSLNDVLIAEDYYSLKFGIPKTVFVARQNQSQENINKLFSLIDTHSNAVKLLNEIYYSIHQPHFVPKSKNSDITNIQIEMCTDGRNDRSIHTLQVNGSDLNIKQLFEESGYTTTCNGKNTGWRIRKQSSDLFDIMKSVKMMNDSVNVIMRVKLINKTFLQLPASHVVPGMNVMVYGNGKIETEEVVERNIVAQQVELFDVDVENSHNLIVNGIFTHNSIYGFSGANCDAIETLLKKERPVVELTLTQNFRSHKLIVEHSNKFSQLKAIPFHTEDGLVKEKLVTEQDMFDMINDNKPLTILVRTNKVIKDLEMRCLKEKYKMRYFNFLTPQDIEYINEGKINAAIKRKLDKVAPYHGNTVKLLKFIEENQNSDTFITSIHKSKGREYPRVLVVNSIDPEQAIEDPGLIEDYSFINTNGDVDVEAQNIHYVACSRPKEEIYFLIYE